MFELCRLFRGLLRGFHLVQRFRLQAEHLGVRGGYSGEECDEHRSYG
jgi:hypothetical protein